MGPASIFCGGFGRFTVRPLRLSVMKHKDLFNSSAKASLRAGEPAPIPTGGVLIQS